MRTYSLAEANSMVREVIEDGLPADLWVRAEISTISERGWHCYMELVEKDADGNTPKAKARANCWQSTWAWLHPKFTKATGERLRPGMQVMLRVSASFHPSFGFAWIVTDIDPTFTLGDMMRRRMEIIQRLKEEGVFDLNKQLRMPLFTQRIAVISSETAAGYGDFMNQLTSNDYGFAFSVSLFGATMQGETVERSVVSALERIFEQVDDFDCVVIIRGGGATSDMSGFDSLPLAENVANFPLPVIVGIGHERDECVLDLIAHTRVKTPTAAAAFLIDRLKRLSDMLDGHEQRIRENVKRKLEYEKLRLARLSEQIPAKAQMAIERSRHRIDMLEQRCKAQDPLLLLNRGYSITTLNGRVVKDPKQVKPGDKLDIRLKNGILFGVSPTFP